MAHSSVELRFINSLRFMGSSLSLLVSNIVGARSFNHIDEDYVAHSGSRRIHPLRDDIHRKFRNLLRGHTNTPFRLLLCKGVYPDEYMDSWSRFDETSLPPVEDSYRSLSEESISQEDYEHAQTVWREFGCCSMADYHDLYLYMDTLLLANVFNEFRDICLANYGLDPVHYCTSPGLS